MKDYHINIFYSDEGKGYIATIPELPACTAFGKTPEEALENLKQLRLRLANQAQDIIEQRETSGSEVAITKAQLEVYQTIVENFLQSQPNVINLFKDVEFGGGFAGKDYTGNVENRINQPPSPLDPISTPYIAPDSNKDNLPKTIAEDLGKGVSLEMVLIPAGSFMMGSKERNNEQPIHEVTFKKAFYIGKYPVTQAQYQAVMENNPSRFKSDNNPVEQVTWNDAKKFCQRLSDITEKTYQLPSESQWEYACRAESTTQWCFGDDKSQLEDYAWYWTNSNGKSHSVGDKPPNNWGLCEMHGNVWEWCEDTWHRNYNDAPIDGTAWVNGGSSNRIRRGGSWRSSHLVCRSAYRLSNNPDVVNCDTYQGFRVVCIV